MSSNEKAIVPAGVESYAPPRASGAFDIARYEAMKGVATEMSKSDLIPKAYHGKPADVLFAMEKLNSLGLNPVAALSGTYVIGNRVSLWGETWLAVLQAAPGYAGMSESWDAATKTATTTFSRVIMGVKQSLSKSFSMEDAKTAKLAGKDTYGNFPQDMITWRARTRAGALFADVLQGMAPAEVAGDYTVELDARQEAPADYVPRRKSEIAAPAAAPALPEQKLSNAPATPAGESFVLADVTVDASGKKDGVEWTIFKIGTVEGGDFYSKEKETADLARSLKGKAVRLTFDVRKGDRRVISHVEPIQE